MTFYRDTIMRAAHRIRVGDRIYVDDVMWTVGGAIISGNKIELSFGGAMIERKTVTLFVDDLVLLESLG